MTEDRLSTDRPDTAAPAPACTNCGEPLPDLTPPPRFCPACGQETTVRPPTLGEFVQQFGGAYLSTEGALWRTLKLLFTRPGELTAQYLAGRRKHYVLPLRLYLTLSVIVLLVMRLAADPDTSFRIDADLRQGEHSILTFGDDMKAGMKDGQFFCRGYPAWVCQRLQRRIDHDPKGLQAQAAEMSQRAFGHVGVAMFFVLPIFAAGLKLLYGNRRLRYTEHLVFALHLHAFWFAALLLLLAGGWLAAAGAVAIPVYAWLAMRRVYRDRWWALLLRSGVLSMLYLLVLSLAFAGVALATLLG